jgi:selenocysteine lyase/cysteine desulfurase
MELVAEWGSAAISARLAMLTGRLADGLAAKGVTLPPAHLRAPHILGVGFPKGMPDQIVERLAAQHIFVARRIGRLRISPHVYNDEADVDRFLEAFGRLLA